MIINKIELYKIKAPLRTPFKTALREVTSISDIMVKITTDTGNIGLGEAAPTGVITGDTYLGIIGAIKDHIAPNLIGLDISNMEEIMSTLHSCIVGNTSAKAAVDMAIYDLFGQLYNIPVYKIFGGFRDDFETDLTISVNNPFTMAQDALVGVNRGYSTLKIKVGNNPDLDIERISAIRNMIGNDINIRLDANQAWNPQQAINILNHMEDLNFNIEFVEQPVLANDFSGLKHVKNNVNIPVMADESIFSYEDALKLIEMNAVDMLNIKLMKTGGIYNAHKITLLAESKKIECMIGCMLETNLSVTAAAHLAGAKSIITKFDLDGPSLCSKLPIKSGVEFNNNKIIISDEPGFGFIYEDIFEKIDFIL